MYMGLHAKCPLFLSDCNETWISSTDFSKILKYQTSWKAVRADRRTDTTKLIFAIRNFANAPNKTDGNTPIREITSSLWGNENKEAVEQRVINMAARYTTGTWLFLLITLPNIVNIPVRGYNLIFKIWSRVVLSVEIHRLAHKTGRIRSIPCKILLLFTDSITSQMHSLFAETSPHNHSLKFKIPVCMYKAQIIDMYGGVEVNIHTMIAIDIPGQLHAFAMYPVRWGTRYRS